MRNQFVVLGFWNILHLLLLFGFSSSLEDYYKNYDDPQSLVFEYSRLAEIENQCSLILSSGSKPNLTDRKIERIKNELSFFNGDWQQENNGLAPLMPLDVSDLSPRINSAPLKLVNFEVKDVRSLDEMQNGVGLGGVMSIGITWTSFYSDLKTKFSMNPGASVLTIVFEGVYVETDGNAGEKRLCLLGNTMLPSRKWLLDWFNEYWGPENRCPNPMEEDQILLILRYPKMSSLTKRTIQGEMKSLHEKGSLKFFDKVLISSQLSLHSNYQFDPAVQSSSCNANVQEELMEDGTNNLSGSDFCRILQEMSNEFFRILPDYHMTNTSTDAGELGPFVLDNEVTFPQNSYNYVRLVMQNIKCKEENPQQETSSAQVSAVFRVVPTASDRFTASSRTGLSGMTLPAEGIWDSSTGQLCMIGSVPKGKEAQVSVYFPRALSVRQRSIVIGTISSSPKSNDSFYPLHFDFIQNPYHLELRYGWYAGSYLSYNYSKIKQADEFRRRSQSFNIIRVLEQSVLRYPAIEQEGGLFSLSQIHDLTDELYIETILATDQLNRAQMSIKLEVVSIGPFLACYDFLYKVRHEGILADATTLLNNDYLLNVSLHMTFSEPIQSAIISQNSVTYMFLEGLYNPQTGTMYLIGCGKVNTGVDVKRGLDCLIEVKVQYPSTNSRWLRDPTVQISISSQRNKDDALYFSKIRLQSNTIKHNIFKNEEHKQDVAFRKIFEGATRVVVLVVMIAILWSQKLYMDQNVGSTPYVSLHMLACEVIGYSLLLITGGEILFPSKETLSYKKHAYDLHNYQPMLKSLSYTAKLLALTTLFLNVRLFLKVSESRKSQSSQEPSKTPLPLGDRRYVLQLLQKFTAIILVLCGVSAIIVSPAEKGRHTIESVQVLLLNQLAHFGRTLHDFSLLAQVGENWKWKNQVKSLRKVYYIGVPLLTMMLKIYDHIRSPISGLYSYGVVKNLNLVYLVYSDIGVLCLMIQVIIVHIQQNSNSFWIINCFSLSRLLNLRKVKQLLSKSKDQ